MTVRELAIYGALEVTPAQQKDDRGVFLEWYKDEQLRDVTGMAMQVRQANTSISRKGTVRGIHFAEVPPSQAKYVTCPHGGVLDVVVDVRVGSPTFGQWDSVLLDAEERKAVYVGEGLGHVFMALTDDAMVSYLCSEPYTPHREHGISPLDPALGIAWPTDIEPLLSAKDAAAPTLDEARAQGLLPSYDECLAFYAELRTRGKA